MTGIYTPTGPFTDGGAPGMSAGFLNNIETWLGILDNPTPITVTGSSGNAKLYMFLRGEIKAGLVFWSSYISSVSQTLALPTAFTSFAYFHVGETQGGTVKFLSSGTAVVCSVQNVMSATGGTQAPETFIQAWSQGQTRGAFDTISLLFSVGTAASGPCFFWGI